MFNFLPSSLYIIKNPNEAWMLSHKPLKPEDKGEEEELETSFKYEMKADQNIKKTTHRNRSIHHAMQKLPLKRKQKSTDALRFAASTTQCQKSPLKKR